MTGRRVLGLLRACPGRAAAMVLLGIGGVVLTTAIPRLVMLAIDDGVVPGDAAVLVAVTALLLAVALARCLAHVVRRVVTGAVAISVQTALRERITRAVLRMEPGWHRENPPGALVSTWNNDVHAVRKLLSFGVTFLVIDLITVLVVLGQLWSLAPVFGLLATALVPVAVVVTAHHDRRARPLADANRALAADVSDLVERNASHITTVRALGSGVVETARLAALSERIRAIQVSSARLRTAYPPLLVGVVDVGVVAVLWLGGRAVVGETMTLGAVVAATAYLTMLVVPVQSSLGLLGTVHEGLAAARRVFAVLDREPPVRQENGPDAVPAERLAFIGVRCAHLAGPVSFDVGPGERLVLVAGSGAGKSTVADLAARFREPASGLVLLDGRDVRGLPMPVVRRSVVVVEQEPILRADSVRANLLVGGPGASDEDLTAALLVAAARDVVEAGLDTPAAALSGGQRQRLAVARAVLARPGVLILDDALTQVDPATEKAVLRGLDQAFAGGLLVLSGRPCPLPFATAGLLRGETAVVS